MEPVEVEDQIERAHLLLVRGQEQAALQMLLELEAQHPGHPEVARMVANIEGRRAQTRTNARDRQSTTSSLRRGVMRFVGMGLLVSAYVLFRTSGGSRWGPVVTAGPIILGMRMIYWRFLFIAALAIAGSVILLISSFMDPDWSDFDNPNSGGCLFGWYRPWF